MTDSADEELELIQWVYRSHIRDTTRVSRALLGRLVRGYAQKHGTTTLEVLISLMDAEARIL